MYDKVMYMDTYGQQRQKPQEEQRWQQKTFCRKGRQDFTLHLICEPLYQTIGGVKMMNSHLSDL